MLQADGTSRLTEPVCWRPTEAEPALAPAQRPAICVLSLSPIADDPRVRRQGEAFDRAGWTVIAVGLPGARSPEPGWRIMTSKDPHAMESGASAAPQSEENNVQIVHKSLEAATLAGSYPTAVVRRPLRSRFRRWSRARLQDVNQRLLHLNKRQCAEIEDRIVRYETALKSALRVAILSVRTLRYRALSGCRKALRQYHRIRAALSPTGRIGYGLRLLAVRIRPRIAQNIYWSFSSNIKDIYACANQAEAVVWLANDWTMLPLAARLAREKGGIYFTTRTNSPRKSTAISGNGGFGIGRWSAPLSANLSRCGSGFGGISRDRRTIGQALSAAQSGHRHQQYPGLRGIPVSADR